MLAEAANSINRCMGLRDLYPFVISDGVSEKLRFVHELLAEKGLAASGTVENEPLRAVG